MLISMHIILGYKHFGVENPLPHLDNWLINPLVFYVYCVLRPINSEVI